MKKVLLLTDFEVSESWCFAKSLCEISKCQILNKSVKLNIVKKVVLHAVYRQLMYFLYPLKWLKECRKYDYVIGWQQFFGLNLAFWMFLLHLPVKCRITVMTFIYNPKKGVIGKIYDKYMRYAVTSKHIHSFIVFAESEVAYYSSYFGLPRDKFKYIPLGLDVDIARITTPLKPYYIFGTGRSNRDWDFLYDSITNSEYKAIIASNLYDKPNNENVTILKSCFGEDMLNRLAQSFCVVLPLKYSNASAGQLVALQAMALGKPVIATNTGSITDYISDGKMVF